MQKVCGEKCEVYSRIVGYLRPMHDWNKGKRAEYSERVPFTEPGSSTPEAMITVDGDTLAEMMAALLNHLSGHKTEDVHQQADTLRAYAHDIPGVLAGEILEMLATQRDILMEAHASAGTVSTPG